MMKRRNILIIACLAIVFFLTVSVASAGLLDFLFPPSKANPDDEVFEAIGGDDFLNVTLKGCLRVSDENLPDASVETGICGDIWYYDAKNVTYVDTEGNEGWFVVWKASPDKYDFFNYTGDINKYISDYLVDGSGKLFLEYSYENHNLYGVILGTGDIQYSEAGLIYDVLGLNRDGFDLIYTSTSPSYTSYSSAGGGGSHYHTVVGDRASVAYSDPGSYYDYYEYGDNYDIDDYLESEGYE